MKTPIFQLFKGSTNPIGSMGPFFLGASLTDEVGLKNDQLTLTLNDNVRQLPLPKKDDLLIVRAGYKETGVRMMGAFKVQGWGTGWEGGGPEVMTMTARAVTFTGEVKAAGTKHFDETTLGDVLRDTAKAAGLSLAIDPDLASIEIPYALRWEASPIDFALRLASEYGAIVKPGGQKLSVIKRGSGKGAEGQQLPIIQVTRAGSSGWHIEGEPRPQQGEVAASYQDLRTGRRKIAKQGTGRQGPTHSLIHPRSSEGAAKAAAEAKKSELNMLSGSGFFVVEFDPSYSAGAKVVASGFGEGIDGTWPSERISTTWQKGSAVLSTIDVTAEPDGKGVQDGGGDE